MTVVYIVGTPIKLFYFIVMSTSTHLIRDSLALKHYKMKNFNFVCSYNSPHTQINFVKAVKIKTLTDFPLIIGNYLFSISTIGCVVNSCHTKSAECRMLLTLLCLYLMVFVSSSFGKSLLITCRNM